MQKLNIELTFGDDGVESNMVFNPVMPEDQSEGFFDRLAFRQQFALMAAYEVRNTISRMVEGLGKSAESLNKESKECPEKTAP